MDKITGSLGKLGIEPSSSPVDYTLRVGDMSLALNSRLGQTIRIEYTGTIYCIGCGQRTRRSYSQGYCYRCFRKLARCDLCILRPTLCHYHEGTCREPEWGRANCLQTHVVYLANTSGLKAGVTSGPSMATRWVDQGAVQALPILRSRTRRQSGIIEAMLAKQVAERTDWRRMLRCRPVSLDLSAHRDALLTRYEQDLAGVADEFDAAPPELIADATERRFNYPILEYPRRVTGISLDKNPLVQGVLQGIKGQYLVMNCGVLNVRKFIGYRVSVALGNDEPSSPFRLEGLQP